MGTILEFSGEVVRGSGDGRKIGCPTANLKVEKPLDIDYGVYATYIYVDGTKYKGVGHYGPRLVFNEYIPQIEVFIFEFDEDIYGKIIYIEFIKRIRLTKNFSSIEDLKEQIKKDIEGAQIILR